MSVFTERGKKWVVAIWVTMFAIIFAAIAWMILTDIPEPEPDKPQMTIFRDAGTGCQYLITKDGSLMPRMSASGRQICQQQPVTKGNN